MTGEEHSDVLRQILEIVDMFEDENRQITTDIMNLDDLRHDADDSDLAVKLWMDGRTAIVRCSTAE